MLKDRNILVQIPCILGALLLPFTYNTRTGIVMFALAIAGLPVGIFARKKGEDKLSIITISTGTLSLAVFIGMLIEMASAKTPCFSYGDTAPPKIT